MEVEVYLKFFIYLVQICKSWMLFDVDALIWLDTIGPEVHTYAYIIKQYIANQGSSKNQEKYCDTFQKNLGKKSIGCWNLGVNFYLLRDCIKTKKIAYISGYFAYFHFLPTSEEGGYRSLSKTGTLYPNQIVFEIHVSQNSIYRNIFVNFLRFN